MKLGILVINLDRSPERLLSMATQLDAFHLAWERLSAVDGNKSEDAPRLAGYSPEINAKKFHRDLSPGEIACFASHRLAWQHILDAGWDGGIILEDDIAFSPDFPDALSALEQAQGQWEALKLMRPVARPVLAQTPLGASQKWTLGDYIKTPVMTAAHAISADAAKRLLKTTEKFGRPVDSELQWWWETGVRFQALLPYPIGIHAETSQSSSLRGKRGKKRKFYKITKLKQQIEYNFQIYTRTLVKHGLLPLLRAKAI